MAIKKTDESGKKTLGGVDFGNGEQLKMLIAQKIQAARKKRDLSQADLAEKVKLSGNMIGRFERGEDTPGPVAAALAAELGADGRQWLLYAEIQRAARESDGDLDSPALRALRQIADKTEDHEADDKVPSTQKSLADFPGRFDGPFWVVVGDRRESRGKKLTPADFGALSASPADLRYFDNLGLKRRDYQIISDKVFVLAPLEELRRRFAQATLIVLGSPASNHAARIINRYSLHRFNLPHDYYDMLESLIREAWKVGAGSETTEAERAAAAAAADGSDASGAAGESDPLVSATDAADTTPVRPPQRRGVDFFTAPRAVPGLDYVDSQSLESLLVKRTRELSWQKHTLFNGGLIDPPYKNLIRGMENSPDRDFGLITLAQNPFRTENDGKFPALFLAGYHLPATCYTLHESVWSDRRSFFSEHPYGGVIRAELRPLAGTGKTFYTYYERMESFSVAWDDDSDYTPEQLLGALELLKASPRANLTRDEAARAHQFLARYMKQS